MGDRVVVLSDDPGDYDEEDEEYCDNCGEPIDDCICDDEPEGSYL